MTEQLCEKKKKRQMTGDHLYGVQTWIDSDHIQQGLKNIGA